MTVRLFVLLFAFSISTPCKAIHIQRLTGTDSQAPGTTGSYVGASIVGMNDQNATVYSALYRLPGDATVHQGLWSGHPTPERPITFDGQPAPGLPGWELWQSDAAHLSSDGNVLFTAFVSQD